MPRRRRGRGCASGWRRYRPPASSFGQRPAVLVVDVNNDFCGDRPEPILKSIRRWPNSCGEKAWVAIERIAVLVDAARRHGVPVVYSTGQQPRPDGFDAGRWADKSARIGDGSVARNPRGNDIVAPIAPTPSDIVITKSKPSVFFGTLLLSYLLDLGVDTLIVCGTTTSGCVRATVVDAFSYNFRVNVVEEGTFDRGDLAHHASLHDMDLKYADVVAVDAALDYLEELPADLFGSRLQGGESHDPGRVDSAATTSVVS